MKIASVAAMAVRGGQVTLSLSKRDSVERRESGGDGPNGTSWHAWINVNKEVSRHKKRPRTEITVPPLEKIVCVLASSKTW